MADTLDIPKIPASEKPVSDDFEYAYVETVNKAFVRIAKERLKEILGANRYTNEEIDQKLSTIPKFNIEVVSSLPTTDISETTIYLVSSGDDSENLYTEYININGLWEILGTQKSTFSGSAKDVTYDDTETKLGATNVQGAIGQLSEEIADLTGGTYSSIEPKEDDIPKVFIDGQIPTSKTDVLAELTYVSKTDNFHAYLEIKCQGDSSMSYPKKNFTIKMYSDEARETKLKKAFRGWGEHNKFVLKANFVDHSHARNIVSAKLWGQIVESRDEYNSLPTGLKTSPNNGAIEGFPIKVYNNGTYQGIYTWNIPKDDWLYGVDEDDPNQFVLYGQKNTDGVYAETANNFRKLWDGVSQSDREWEVEVGTNSDIVKTALNNVISLCMNADDATFKNTLGNYLDVQSALDYYIFVYTICALDSLAQNMILVSYDGTKLYCSAYDLDSTFGLWWNGQSFVSTSYRCPEDYQERYSLLWERIEKLYAEELKERYAELRNSVLSLSNMFTQFERFMDRIGLDLYAEDLTVYTGIPSGSTNNIKQIRNYIRDRLTYCDAEFEAMNGETEPDIPEETIPATGIALNQTYLSFTNGTPITLTATVEPSNTTDKVTWSSDDTSIATVVGGVVTPIANGDCVITATCGTQIATCSVSVSGFVDTTIAEPVPLGDSVTLTLDGSENETWKVVNLSAHTSAGYSAFEIDISRMMSSHFITLPSDNNAVADMECSGFNVVAYNTLKATPQEAVTTIVYNGISLLTFEMLSNKLESADVVGLKKYLQENNLNIEFGLVSSNSYKFNDLELGTYVDGLPTASSIEIRTSKYVVIDNEFTQLSINTDNWSMSNTNVVVWFYDSSKNYMSAGNVYIPKQTSSLNTTISIPSGASYFKVRFATTDMESEYYYTFN